jgi:hypothetical protein
VSIFKQAHGEKVKDNFGEIYFKAFPVLLYKFKWACAIFITIILLYFLYDCVV